MSVAPIVCNIQLQKINVFAQQDSSMILCPSLVSNGFVEQLIPSIIRFNEVLIASLAQCGKPVMVRTDV